MHFYTFNIGNYRRDAMHLTLLEHGIYRQLIDSYYLQEGPLTGDIAVLMRTHGIRSNDEREALENVLRDFFEHSEDGYRHPGCDKIISEVMKKSEAARNSAQARWERKDANAMRTHTERNALAMLPKTQDPLPDTQEIKTSSGNGLPPCPHEQIVELFHKTLPELPEVRIWNQTRQGFLKARWREMATQEKWESQEAGIAWFEKFFTWLRQSRFLMGKVTPRPGARAFECELEWILRPQNWTKIVEGKYHAG